MISLDIMDRSKYEIIIKNHCFLRAMQRGIHPDLIEDTIMKGKLEKFGKTYAKFISKNLICVGEMSATRIKIITIEWRKK